MHQLQVYACVNLVVSPDDSIIVDKSNAKHSFWIKAQKFAINQCNLIFI